MYVNVKVYKTEFQSQSDQFSRRNYLSSEFEVMINSPLLQEGKLLIHRVLECFSSFPSLPDFDDSVQKIGSDLICGFKGKSGKRHGKEFLCSTRPFKKQK